jgi:hypothetical protein
MEFGTKSATVGLRTFLLFAVILGLGMAVSGTALLLGFGLIALAHKTRS